MRDLQMSWQIFIAISEIGVGLPNKNVFSYRQLICTQEKQYQDNRRWQQNT